MRHQVISKNQAAALIGLTLLLQFLLQSYFVPLDELLTAKRLAHIDSVYHQYMMEATAAYCGEGRLTECQITVLRKMSS